ncbi:Arylsulfatase [Lecanosticta acicola]|uniref:Arylsulfatase n=1 Tax=Lecanosticta acicola TaxID=111012 RepID=A0AAI9EDV7_9PEZI|nr:Arylsulfatase [Lecanosticta acicola]
MKTACLAAASCSLLSFATGTQVPLTSHENGLQSKRPNIVFILTDDQDHNMQSLDYMPLLKKHLVDRGTSFEKHYCTVSICCPSRVNLWTGRAAHNTNVTDLKPPYGGYPKFVQEGLNEDWLMIWLQRENYNTYYTGKLFNAHNVHNYNDPLVKGLNGSDFLLDPFTYEYFNAWMTRNGEEPVSYAGHYSPDVVADKAKGFLDQAAQLYQDTGRPFFLGVAPIAPHSNMHVGEHLVSDMPKYAERHKHLFKDYKIPRTKNFNPDRPSGVGWVRKLPKLNSTVIEYHDELVRSRLRALQSVDEMVETLVQTLEAKGLMENTYIFYTSDNGYHVGQHRLPPGKECAFEEDIHVPLIVRGPGVPKGNIVNAVSSHTDLTPTVLKLADVERPDLDGLAIPLTAEELSEPVSGEHVNVEYWGGALPEGQYGVIGDYPWPGLGPIAARNNTYKALRIAGEHYSLLYTVWCTGEKEYYDVKRDPYQMQNLLGEGQGHLIEDYKISDRSFKHILNRADALLMVLKSCKGESCRRPWSVLHPDGNVKSLADALHASFDDFYSSQPKINFDSCQMGYIKSEEGPQDVNVWNDETRSPLSSVQKPLQYEGHWSWWT